MLFITKLKAHATAECIFNTVYGYFENHGISLTNLLQISTDGASNMDWSTQ